MDPASAIDVASALRGLGRRRSKLHKVIAPPAPRDLSVHLLGRPVPEAGHRPAGTRDPTWGNLPAPPAGDFVADVRDVRSIIGVPSRMDARWEMQGPAR